MRQSGEAMFVSGARSSSEDRVAQLYEQQRPSAVRFATVLTGQSDTARDLVQEAFVRILGRLRKVPDEPHALSGYLRQTMLNLWRSRLRRRQIERRHAAREAQEPQETIDLDTRELIWRAMMRLPLRQRTALYLRYYEDLPTAEIARQLDCSEGAARSAILHGLQKLRTNQEVASGIED